MQLRKAVFEQGHQLFISVAAVCGGIDELQLLRNGRLALLLAACLQGRGGVQPQIHLARSALVDERAAVIAQVQGKRFQGCRLGGVLDVQSQLRKRAAVIGQQT